MTAVTDPRRGAVAHPAARLFVAVAVPPTVGAAVAEGIAPLRAAAPTLRWVAPPRYHLTVVFLGAVDPAAMDAVATAVAAVSVGTAPFPLRLDGRLATFGRTVLWAGVAPSPPLARLAGALRTALSTCVALPDADRPFAAHLTLARARRGERVPAALAGASLPAPPAWQVADTVVLSSSGPARASYPVVARCPLGAGAGA